MLNACKCVNDHGKSVPFNTAHADPFPFFSFPNTINSSTAASSWSSRIPLNVSPLGYTPCFAVANISDTWVPFCVHNLWRTLFSVSTSCVCIFVPVSPDFCCCAISTHQVSFFCLKTASSVCPSFPRVKHQILSSQHVPAPARTTPKYLQTYFIFPGNTAGKQYRAQDARCGRPAHNIWPLWSDF